MRENGRQWTMVLGVLWLAGCPVGTTSPTTKTGETGTPTTDTTTTPTPTTTDVCPELDLNTGSPACDACLEESCCTEAQAYFGVENDVGALSDCSVAHCSEDCAWGICDSGVGLPQLEVALCASDSCCAITKSCFADAHCSACVTSGNPNECTQTSLDEQFISCLASCGYDFSTQ